MMISLRVSFLRRCGRLEKVMVGLLSLASLAPAHAATLSASFAARPNMALFKPGEAVNIQFQATGVGPGQSLIVTIQDARDAVVFTESYGISSGPAWAKTVAAYNAKLGFYRVFARLSTGEALPAVGSRPAGFITYCVVPDPAQRPASIPAEEAHFGMQGGFNSAVGTDILAFLGVRWTADGGWTWSRLSPTYNRPFDGSNPPGRGFAWATNGAGGPWPVHSLPNLTKNGRPYGGNPDVYKAGTFEYNTGALKPEYYGDWTAFCSRVAASWPTVYSERARPVYEVTWEPIQLWGYRGTDADLVTLYRLAYQSIKAADADAWVAGPCMGVNSLANMGQIDELFALGLGNYLDAFTAHPYMDHDVATSQTPFRDPEAAGQPCLLATMKRKLRGYMGGDIPMYGTEQGYRTRQDTTQEIEQARRLIRSHLMVLGEGWRANIAFYFGDYYSTDNLNRQAYWDWGFFYNLDPGAFDGYAPGKVSPKPVAAAYAAMTFLLERRKSVCDVNWLSDTTRGYAFQSHQDPNDVVLALWDFGASPRTLTIPTGAANVEIWDWMGNRQAVATAGGNVALTLTKEPTYIKGVAAGVWGAFRPNRNIAKGRPVTVSSTASAAYPGHLAVDGDSVSYLSRWVSAADSAAAKWIEIDLGGNHTVTEVRFWTGDYEEGTGKNTYGYPIPSFSIQRWNGAAWTTIVSRTGNTRAVVVEPFAAVTTGKIRLHIPSWVISQVKLYEIEVLATTSPMVTTGAITREHWTGISGVSLAGLMAHPNFPAHPQGRTSLSIFEAPSSFGENYGQRILGYLYPPMTGNYFFWIASDDEGELWLSSTSNPTEKVLIARVPGYTSSRQWTKYPEQKSAAVPLAAGKSYYIEARHKEGTGGDNLAVGWQLPDGTQERPIPGFRLSPNSLPDWWEIQYDLDLLSTAGALDDQDNDGMPNLLELAFGGHPRMADAGERHPRAVLTMQGGASYLGVEWRRRRDLGGMIFRVQESTDLQTWQDIDLESNLVGAPVDMGDGTDLIRVKGTLRSLGSPASPRGFMRVRVDPP